MCCCKEIANAHRGNNRFKIKLLLPQGKNIDAKVHGNVVGQVRVRRCAVFPARCRDRQYYHINKYININI